MNQWINQFLENEIVNRTDKTDKSKDEESLSVLSVRPLRFLDEKKVENNPETGTDKTDKPINEGPLSVLSVRPLRLLDEKMVNLEINLRKEGDKSDRFRFEPNMSPHDGGLLSALSVPLKGPFAETSFYPLDATSLLNEYQERFAISEYDGLQTSTQAERIAYLDAFMAVLATLPYEDVEEDWLAQRIKAAQAWLLDQGFAQPG